MTTKHNTAKELNKKKDHKN